jgi:type II secretory pathway pseudopilin PulG
MSIQWNSNKRGKIASFAARLHSEQGYDSKRAFTLVELLAVLGAVALLTMLMLPALANSNSTSARVVCTDNMRRMGAACNLYANDHGDYMALPNWGTNLQGRLWTNGAYPSIPLGPGQNLRTPNAQVNWTKAQQYYPLGLWYQYMPNARSYICPLDAKDPTFVYRPNWLCTYVMNGAVSDYPLAGATQTSCKITAVWNPGCYLMWEPNIESLIPYNEGEYNDGGAYPNNAEGMETLHTVNGGEIVTVGGNVDFVTTQKWDAESSASGESLTWWSPASPNGH